MFLLRTLLDISLPPCSRGFYVLDCLLPSPLTFQSGRLLCWHLLGAVESCPWYLSVFCDSCSDLVVVGFFFLDLWKHQVMKENFSVMRPQIVEKFIQRLMESSQDDGPEVCTQNELLCSPLNRNTHEEGCH